MGLEEDEFKRRRQIVLLTAIPMVLVAGPLVGFLIGQFLDQKLGTSPWLLVLFLILGGVAGVKQMLRLLSKAQEK